MKTSSGLRNVLGAFSDGAVLFPLLALLTLKAGFSGGIILFSTGIAYIVAALLFRVPMAVQPLKSIAVAAITVGASFSEVRLSGMLLGAFCLFMCLFDVDRIAKKVPEAMIHGLQAGLGVLLVLQGLKAGGDFTLMVSSLGGILALLGAVLMLIWPEVAGIPVLGLVATIGLGIAVFFPASTGASIVSTDNEVVRPMLIVGLLLPQIVLTSANSVLATRNVCERYFKDQVRHVTIRRLLYSIGFGNLLTGLIGGMPFCHGSGGVTAHVRGGSTKAWSTAFMGLLLLILSWVQFQNPSSSIIYPPLLVATLLIATGVFHLKLAAPTAQTNFGKVKVVAALSLTLLTRNLLWVLGAAVLFEVLGARLNTMGFQRKKQMELGA